VESSRWARPGPGTLGPQNAPAGSYKPWRLASRRDVPRLRGLCLSRPDQGDLPRQRVHGSRPARSLRMMAGSAGPRGLARRRGAPPAVPVLVMSPGRSPASHRGSTMAIVTLVVPLIFGAEAAVDHRGRAFGRTSDLPTRQPAGDGAVRSLTAASPPVASPPVPTRPGWL